jgi:ethanolamine utilization protein EutQ
LITGDVVAQEFAAGRTRIAAAPGECVITPAAWTKAFELGVTFDRSATVTPVKPDATPTQGRSTREVDASGIVVVRGESVELTPFAAAGAGKKVGMADLVTGRDGAPMTAGIMSWAREDSFAWKLDYDEVDLVLEGVLHVTIDGRTLEAKAGDVVYLPKGSSIVFGTPWRTKVFYVTYPADWAGGAR